MTSFVACFCHEFVTEFSEFLEIDRKITSNLFLVMFIRVYSYIKETFVRLINRNKN